MSNHARSCVPYRDGPTIVMCTNADAAALVVVALVDDAHLQPGYAFSVAPVFAFDAPFTFTITAPLPLDVVQQIGTIPDTTIDLMVPTIRSSTPSRRT